jgi:hypothetical protein
MDAVEGEVDGGGVDPERDQASGLPGAEPELLAADPEVPARGHDAVDLHRSQGGIDGCGPDFLAGEGGRVDRGLEVGIRVGFVVGQPSELGRGPERQDGALLDGGSG